jgi:ribonuclease III
MLNELVPTFSEEISGVIGYRFQNEDLLKAALTHASSSRRAADYQRLEFLGDRVLSLVIAEVLYRQHANENEGQMATRHSALVRGETCADVGLAMNIADYIIVGPIEKRKGVQQMRSVVADVVEALIGAIYLDGGFESAQTFIIKGWKEALARPRALEKDPKTFLQEWALGRALPLPRYEIKFRTGPEHQPEFTVSLNVGKYEVIFGKGASRQAAEMAAAAGFLQREGLR